MKLRYIQLKSIEPIYMYSRTGFVQMVYTLYPLEVVKAISI